MYDYVIFDSDNEKTFAQLFENHKDVIEFYVKLPDWFKIDTPLGSYNPDWAVVVKDDDGGKRLYLVVETKGNTSENAKHIFRRSVKMSISRRQATSMI